MTPFALVTGTSSGLGLALAELLVDRGWTVLGVARRSAPIDRAAPLERAGYTHQQADLGQSASLAEHFDARFPDRWRLAERPRIALVNNAAVLGPVGAITAADPVAFTQAMAINVTAPAWLTGRFAEWCAARCPTTPLRVVNVSSGAAHKPYPGWGAYCASKAALHLLGATIGVEADEMPALAGSNLRIVGFAPGVVDTAMQTAIRARSVDEMPRVQRFLDLKRDGDLLPPEAPAAAIADLLGRDDLPRFHETRYTPRA